MKYSDWIKMGTSNVTQIEHLTQEDFHLLRSEIQQNKEKVDKNCEYFERCIVDLYARHDTMREDLNEMRWHDGVLRHLLSRMDELEGAPKIGKRRRRVTIIQG